MSSARPGRRVRVQPHARRQGSPHLGPAGRRPGARGGVLAVGKPDAPSQLDRIVAGHALSLFAIELAKSRAVAEAERRLQGDFFDALASGPSRRRRRSEASLGSASIAGRTSSWWRSRAVAAAPRSSPTRWKTTCRVRRRVPHLAERGRRARADGLRAAAGARALRGALAERLGDLRLGSGGAVTPDQVDRSLREARYALQVCRLEGWDRRASKTSGRTGCSCR